MNGRWSMMALALVALASSPAWADEPPATILNPISPAAPKAPGTLVPGGTPPLVGLDSSALALAPPGAAAAARNDGLAGSPQTGIDLSYIPPAERDSYLNSREFQDHLQTSTRRGHHPSALSQLGGAGEALAINGLLGAGTSLVLGGH